MADCADPDILNTIRTVAGLATTLVSSSVAAEDWRPGFIWCIHIRGCGRALHQVGQILFWWDSVLSALTGNIRTGYWISCTLRCFFFQVSGREPRFSCMRGIGSISTPSPFQGGYLLHKRLTKGDRLLATACYSFNLFVYGNNACAQSHKLVKKSNALDWQGIAYERAVEICESVELKSTKPLIQ